MCRLSESNYSNPPTQAHDFIFASDMKISIHISFFLFTIVFRERERERQKNRYTI